MALAKKRKLLYQLRPDIAVIPECSSDSMVICEEDGFDTCWWGENRHKGLGVVAAKPWALKIASPPDQRWIVPASVHGPVDFLMVAVWACPVGGEKESNYIGQVYEAIVKHPKWFAGGAPVVICGDFNSNAIFDHKRKRMTHSAVVKLLADRGLVSAYHLFFGEHQGQESRPTHYFWHRKERPFHLDYIFVPQIWRHSILHFEVGTYRKWRGSSDHVPILVDIAIDSPGSSRPMSKQEGIP
jgi:exonuclease III